MPSLHSHTPSLTVIDSRSLVVRQVSFHCAAVNGAIQTRTASLTHDVAGRVDASRDPRLFARLADDPTTPANVVNIHSLSSTVLSTDSVDAGWKVRLFGEAGNPLQTWDERDNRWSSEYDEVLRPISFYVHCGQTLRAAERFSYTETSHEAAANNLCGQMTRHDDEAGTHLIRALDLRGHPQIETRHFLQTLERPDWPLAVEQRDALLEPGDGWTTTARMAAVGDLITRTDAKGNQCAYGYGVSGQLGRVELRLAAAQAPVILLQDASYNALGQIVSQTAGNGCVTTALFSDTHGRLRELSAQKPDGTPLQHCIYQHDPVGNVVRIEDKAQASRHYANQRIDPVSCYQHDSLYQLISATGRETASATAGPQLPELAALPLDTSQLLNYTEHYQYDAAGNMLELRHEGQQCHTRTMAVDDLSNRAVIWQQGDPAPDFATLFDSAGNLQQLAPGQPLHWDNRNQLCKLDTVTRKDADNDGEWYVYDGSGQRVRKAATASAKSVGHSREVRYLPGLELRTDSTRNEYLQVITLQAGRCAVRCLHWENGKPDEVANDPLRYSFDDHLGSSVLELDADARLISHEGYYPYGGTAWWAARSAIEAKYKVVRYSAKERDASGLYYYGLRFYAPWLMRWINPDPMGYVDGLNLYQMVSNNPISKIDRQGAEGEFAGFTDTQLLIAIAVILVVGALIRAVYQTIQEEHGAAPRDTRSPIDIFIANNQSDYSLTGAEGKSIRTFAKDHELKGSHLRLHGLDSGELHAFGLRNSRLQDHFDNHIRNTQAMMNNVPRLLVREARRSEQAEEAQKLSVPRIPTPSGSGTRFNLAPPKENQGIINKTKAAKMKESGGNAVSETSSEPAPAIEPRPTYRVDRTGFLEDQNVAGWLQAHPDRYDAVVNALDNFDPTRRLHRGLFGLFTEDIQTPDAAAGRGDLRLGFHQDGNTFRPLAILSHKPKGRVKGKILVMRRDV